MNQDTGQIKKLKDLTPAERGSGRWRVVTPSMVRRLKEKASAKKRKKQLIKTFNVTGKRARALIRRHRRTGSVAG
jgi:predicted secreted protein